MLPGLSGLLGISFHNHLAGEDHRLSHFESLPLTSTVIKESRESVPLPEHPPPSKWRGRGAFQGLRYATDVKKPSTW